MQYLRYGQHFVLISTPGDHNPLRADHTLRDAHDVPIKLAGYAASSRGGYAHVRIEREAWKELQAYYLGLATKRPPSWFEREFRRWPFEPWAPIRRQTFVILNQVNRAQSRRARTRPALVRAAQSVDLPALRPPGAPHPRGGLTRLAAGR